MSTEDEILAAAERYRAACIHRDAAYEAMLRAEKERTSTFEAWSAAGADQTVAKAALFEAIMGRGVSGQETQ